MSSEQEAVAAASQPATVGTLVDDLRALGVDEGDVVMVHSSLSSIGWVAGGAQAVVEALLRTVGPTGTVVMATQSSQLSNPASWQHPPVPAEWVPLVQASLPAFDVHLTPTRGMGAVVECFRHHPATVRSGHPTLSFAANGPAAAQILGTHPLRPGLGDASPLGRLYELGASVLLLGVGHNSNTSLHLAEHRALWPGRKEVDHSVPMLVDGVRRWMTYPDLPTDADDFDDIGRAYDLDGRHRRSHVGSGWVSWYPVVDLVDFAADWMCYHRGRPAPAPG